MTLELSPGFAAQLPDGIDVFAYLMQLDGEIYRDIANRRTLRFTLNGRRYFLKAHYGVGWKEILKNLLSFACRYWAHAMNGAPFRRSRNWVWIP